MGSIVDFVKIIVIAQLFYAFGITLVVYSLPSDELTYVTLFETPANDYSFEEISGSVESGATDQLALPLIDLTTLVGYSGNLLVDMVFNFLTAVPQMLTLIVGAFTLFFAVDSTLAVSIKLFFMALIQLLYIIAVISFVLNIRSQGSVIA